ncbi:DMT family transporter [Virgibacillus byunsanensis]|uniref:DMT family transporter n=1 Tax=Virgibacillus byunsanensis TaxID=570945 RepID=A0ABW3LFG1_9BACI
MQNRNSSNSLVTLLEKNRYIIWSFILVITIIWGYAWVLMKESLDYMGPFTFNAFRFGIGSLTLLGIIGILKLELPAKNEWKHLIIVGILQTSIVFLLVMYGLRFIDAGKSSVLLYSMPIWSSMFASKILGEKLAGVKVIGLTIGMAGLLTILGWDIVLVQDMQVIFGELLIIIAAISWGASNVYYRLKLQDIGKLQVTAFQMLFGTIGIILAAVMMEWGEPIHLNANSIFYVLFTGVLASALCFSLWFLLLSVIDMVTATLSTLLVPIFGLLLSALILGEELTTGILTGSVLIIAGIGIAQLSKRRKE